MICSFPSLRTLLLAALATAMVTSAHDANAGFFKRDKTEAEAKTDAAVSTEVAKEPAAKEIAKTEKIKASAAVTTPKEVVKTDAAYTPKTSTKKIVAVKAPTTTVRTPTTIYKFNE